MTEQPAGRLAQPAANRLGPALAITFGTQVVMAMPVGVASVLTVAMTQSVGLPPSMLGVFVGILWTGALVAVPFSGTMLARVGPVRALQLCLALTALAALLIASGALWMMALGAFLLGIAVGPEVPASVQLLARITTPRQRPFVMSAKSTGWQCGMAILGLSAPPLTALFGWQGCVAIYATANLVFALAQEPLRRRYDADHPPSPSRRGTTLDSIRAIGRSADLVRLTVAAVVLSIALTCFMTFLVSLLRIELGYALAIAGTIYACGQMGAVAGRLMGGAIAGRWIAPTSFLMLVGFSMAATSVALGASNPSWPVAMVAVAAVLAGVAGGGWLGVCLSECARLAPSDQVGLVTGGVLFFHYLTLIITPLAFAAFAAKLGYGWAFIAVGVVTVSGLLPLVLKRPKPV